MEHNHDGMLRRGKAVEHMLTVRQTLLTDRSTETVALGEGINGRVLAQRIDAERDVPAFDYATMDGYALNTSDDYPLDIVDTGVFPESEPLALEEGQAIRTATGAPIPERANAVLKKRRQPSKMVGSMELLSNRGPSFTSVRVTSPLVRHSSKRTSASQRRMQHSSAISELKQLRSTSHSR
ncbi:hypothetical protein ACFQL7_08445 [Halocatena marina]|uniref:MoeA N-terminal and linker domain-containing protein n=1 Tax=Halocatena marina TaxID=2934937 RepID=A0ABD5YP29_9EURY